MRAVGAFMAWNSDLNDVEEYYLNWLKVLYCVRRLGFESYVCHLCIVWFIINFNNMHDYVEW